MLSLFDMRRDEIEALFAHTGRLKKALAAGKRIAPLAGKVLALLFEKPSLRTRVSFQAGMAQLGGTSLFLAGSEVGLGTRETIADCARTLNEYVDGVVLRVFAHKTVEEYAKHSSVPVINGLSDLDHPCQALGDLYTMLEVFGSLKGLTVAFIGDGNNMARSLAIGCAALGLRYCHAAPTLYRVNGEFVERLQAEYPKANVDFHCSAKDAVARANVIYTDVWASMGQEAEHFMRKQAFSHFQVNGALLADAPKDAIVMHCLPAHRGEEITDEVIDSERSVVFRQAGNRMHVQKALIHWLVGGLELVPAKRPRPAPAANGRHHAAKKSKRKAR
jgi:ornithine carbamoyltransferase